MSTYRCATGYITMETGKWKHVHALPHTQKHTNWNVKNGSASGLIWKAKAVCPNEDKENNHSQTHQHPNLQALTNTHTGENECVCVCVQVLVEMAVALAVQIYYKYRLSVDVQHHMHAAKHWVNNTLKNDLFISTALHTHKLWTIDFAPALIHKHTETWTDKQHSTACKHTLNTCHNKELPASKHKDTPHIRHKETLTHTLVLNHLIKRTF